MCAHVFGSRLALCENIAGLGCHLRARRRLECALLVSTSVLSPSLAAPGAWQIRDGGPGAPCEEVGAPLEGVWRPAYGRPGCRVAPTAGISQLPRAASPPPPPPLPQCGHHCTRLRRVAQASARRLDLGLVPSHSLAVTVRRPGLRTGGWGGGAGGSEARSSACHLRKQR